MRRFHARLLSAFGVALVAAAGCKDANDPAPRVTPRSIEMLAGDGQQATRGYPIEQPLRVRLLGSDGRPMSGTSIRWSSPSATTTIEPSESVTDASGEAQTRVAVVGGLGRIEIHASVTGIAPAVFAISGLDPCYFANAPYLVLGAPRSATLSSLDCVLSNHSNDLYVVSNDAPRALTLRMRASGFDPMVVLYPFLEDWYFWWSDSDDATRDAHFKVLVPLNDYGLIATSVDEGAQGPYQVSATPTPESAEQCEFVLAYPGTRTRQTLSATDCAGVGDTHADVFAYIIEAGERVIITETSTAFAPYLRLLKDGVVVAERDGTVSGTAFVEYVAEEFGLYEISASSATPNATGAYELVADRAIIIGGSTASLPSVHSSGLNREEADETRISIDRHSGRGRGVARRLRP